MSKFISFWILFLNLTISVYSSDIVEPIGFKCNTWEECVEKRIQFEKQLNQIDQFLRTKPILQPSSIVGSGSVNPDNGKEIISLFELYKKRMLEGKRNVNRNFQTQGWRK